MICYKDRTWCPLSINTLCSRREGCYRAFTEEDRKNAEAWWGGPDFPISQYVEKPSCFIPINIKEESDGEK